NITDEMNAGLLHDILMKKGADLLVKTVKAIESGNFETIPQDEVIVSDKELKKAPKIFRNDCRIDWDQDVKKVYNHIRGLSPYPAAYTELIDKEGNVLSLRIYTTEMIEGRHDASPYEILTDEKTYIYITTEGGLISLLDVQLQGKKRMKTQEFLRGFQIRNYKIKPASSQLT
ncbi:MAG: methionyl-tRNA formyltransferase, partial [Bacteroidota bacterium]